jgi:hypothetical protein
VEPILREQFRQQMILSSFYTYRNITNDELKKYMQFYVSDTGKKEIEITGKALGHVLKEWIADVGAKIMVLAKEEAEKQKN